MKIFRLSHLLLCTTLLLGATALRAEPLLNGMAVSSELGKERFIAAIYSSSLSKDANALLTSSGERRMELKVVADRFSARSLNSMWIEGMAINNPGAALEREADNMAKLNNMVRKSLTAGDVLRIDAAPGQGTSISLNGTELGRINSDEFFSMLLRTWIGSVPLSTEFKDSLLAAGEVNSGLAARYATIEPTPGRVDAVAAWLEPEEPAEPQQVAASPTIAPPRPSVSVDIAPPPISNPGSAASSRPAASNTGAASSANQNAGNTGNAASNQTASASGANTAGTTRGSAATPAPAATSNAGAASANTQVAANDAGNNAAATQGNAAGNAQSTQVARADVPARPVTPARPTPAPVEDDEEEEEELVVSGASILARQFYVTEVIRKSMQVLEYPRRAIQRNQQGSVRLSVTVDRNGQVLDVTTLEESRYSLLNKEAVDIVARAAPFPPLPDALKGPSLTFALPVVFILN